MAKKNPRYLRYLRLTNVRDYVRRVHAEPAEDAKKNHGKPGKRKIRVICG